MDASRRLAETFLVEPLERRLLLNGTLDPSFGTDGLVTFDFGVATPVAGAAIQREVLVAPPVDKVIEKVIVAGRGFQLARFLSSGVLDTSFDVDGKVIPASLPPAASAEDVAVYVDRTNPDFGKIVVVGTSNDPFAIPQVTLLRFNANGTPDTMFGTGGVVQFQTHSIAGGLSVGKAVAIDADGRIVVAATSWNRSVQFQSLLRFLPNGAPDPNFGIVAGQFNFFFGGPGQAFAIEESVAIAIQPTDGRILVAGIGQDTVGRFVLVRINPTGGLIGRGDLDPTFGNGGKVVTDFATSGPNPNDPPAPHHASTVGMALAPDNDVVLAGSVQGIIGPLEMSGSNFAATRYEIGNIGFRDGDLSPPFGLPFLPGRAAHDFELVSNAPAAIVIQPEPATSSHKIILAGGTARAAAGGEGSGGDFALLRLTPTGAPDPTFGNGGWVVTDFGNTAVSSDDGAAALLLTENDTLTAIGQVRRGGGLRSIGLARYHIGNPDRDGDGVPNAVEDAHPDKLANDPFGDGNADDHRDADQERVASLPAAVVGAPYVTITADPSRLRHVQAIVGDATLRGATRPVGTFSFQVEGGVADIGFHFTATPGGMPDRFFAFGPTPDDPIPHWYDVPLVPVAGPDLRFRVIDGGLGDNDRMANGIITIVGAPVKLDATPLSITGSVFNDLDGDGLLDLGFPPEPALSGWRVFLDEDGDGSWDAGEAWALSDDESAYAFIDDDTLAAGAFRQEPSNGGLKAYVNLERRTYRVAAAPFDPQPGWISTLPPAYQSLDVGAGGRAITHRVVTGDIDGDGDNDLIALAVQLDAVPTRRIHVFRNRGDGRFDPVSGLSGLLDDANADDVVIGRFNNDPYPDIAVTSSTGALSLVDVYLADGQGGFLAPLNSAGMGDDLLLIAEAADLDEDGVLDLVIGTKHLLDDPQRTEKGRLGFLRGIGNGRFEPARIFEALEFSDVRPITELAVGEFTGDAHADVVTTMVDHAGYQLWVGDGDGNLALRQGLPPGFAEDPLFRRLTLTPPLATVFGAQPITFVSGFFDNDPDRDYVIRGAGPGDIAVVPSLPPVHLARLGGDPQPVLLFGERPLFGGAIRGAVLHDIDSDGTQDAGEPWATGTRVVLDLNGNGTFNLGIDRQATARADGSYSFDAVPPGKYGVFVRLEPGYEATAPAGGSARVAVGDVVATQIFGVRGIPGTVSGVVWDDLDGDDQPDANEPGIPNVLVLLDWSSGGRSTTTDAQGRFEFAGAPTIVATFVRPSVTPTGYVRTFPDPALPVTQQLNVPGGATAVANFGFGRPGTIRGTLWIERDFDGVPDPDETRPAGALVWIDLDANGAADVGEPATLTGADGSYVLANVPPGNHLIGAHKSSTFTDPTGSAFGFSVAAWERQIVVGDPGFQRKGRLNVLDAFSGSLLFRKLGYQDHTANDRWEFSQLLRLAQRLLSIGGLDPEADADWAFTRGPVPGTLGFAVATSGGRVIASSLGDGTGYAGVYALTGETEDYMSPGYFVAPILYRLTAGDPLPGYLLAHADGHIVATRPVMDQDRELRWNAGFPIESVAGLGVGKFVAGSPESATNGIAWSGVAYLVSSDTTLVLQEFHAPDPAESDGFGTAVAAYGEDVIIGAPGAEEGPDPADAGVAYVMDSATGQVRWTLRNPYPGAGDHFGFAVAAVGNLIMVGAPHDDARGTDAGAVYLFDGRTGRHVGTVFSPSPMPGALFGFSLAAGGNDRFIVGAPALGTNAGAAHVFSTGTGVSLLSGQDLSSRSFPVPHVERPDGDADGVPDAIEAAAPNNGDGNADGAPDASQRHVASLQGGTQGTYVTLETTAGIQLQNVRVIPGPALPGDAEFDVPVWRVAFAVDVPLGGSATIGLYHYGTFGLNGQTYRKYGPSTPGEESTVGWYSLGGVTYDTVDVGGWPVGRVRFTLTDGERGDETGVDGRIVDPGGPALADAPAAMLKLTYLSGTRWTQAFRDAVWADGMGHQGFGFTTDAAHPSETLPWAGLNKVSLRFDRPVTPTLQDLVVRGGGGTYAVTGFVYDERTRTGTWTLGRALGAGRVMLNLAERVTGVPLAIPIAVLPGDVTHNGRVDAADLRQVRSRLGGRAAATSPGIPTGYAAFDDVNADGRVNVLDVQLVRANYLSSLPAVVVAPSPGATLRRRATVRGELFATTGVFA